MGTRSKGSGEYGSRWKKLRQTANVSKEQKDFMPLVAPKARNGGDDGGARPRNVETTGAIFGSTQPGHPFLGRRNE